MKALVSHGLYPAVLLLFAAIIFNLVAVVPALAQECANFSDIAYGASDDAGRIIVTGNMSARTDTCGWTVLPLGNLVLRDIFVDGGDAVISGASRPQPSVWLKHGIHDVRFTATLPILRGENGAYAEWIPTLAGLLVIQDRLRVEGDVSGRGSRAVLAKQTVRLIPRRSTNEDAGTWSIDAAIDFQIDGRHLTADVEINYDAVGNAPDSILIQLPAGLLPVSGTEELDFRSHAIFLKPEKSKGVVRFQAEAVVDGNTIDLSGVRFSPSDRVRLTLSVVAAEGSVIDLHAGAGLSIDGARFKVFGNSYALSASVRPVNGVELHDAIVVDARIATTLMEDGRAFTQWDYRVEGRLPSRLAVRLPPSAEILSVSVNGTGVAPLRSQDSIIVSLNPADQSCDIRFIYRHVNDMTASALSRFLTPPFVDLPVKNAVWDVRTPDGLCVVSAGDVWIPGMMRGNISLPLDIPKEGTLHSFFRADMRATDNLHLRFLTSRVWFLIFFSLAGGAGFLLFKQIHRLPQVLIGAAILQAIFTGAVMAAVFGAALGTIARRIMIKRLRAATDRHVSGTDRHVAATDRHVVGNS